MASPEKSRQNETIHSPWVPFRENTLGIQPPVWYGKIGWIPSDIHMGTQLEINTNSANILIDRLGLPRIGILSAPTQDQQDHVEISSVSANGEATMAKTSAKLKKPKGDVFIDPNGNNAAVIIDFKGIYDYIKVKNPQKPEQQITSAYGKELNTQLMRLFKQAVSLRMQIAEKTDRRISRDYAFCEFSVKLIALFHAVQNLQYLTHLTPEKALAIFGNYLTTMFFVWNLSAITEFAVFHEYRPYPDRYVKYHLIPNTILSIWDKPLIRAK